MERKYLNSKASKATYDLLHCKDDIAIMKQSVDALYEIFLQSSEVSAYNQNDDSIYLKSGKAISPAQAAHCLLEMKRTTVFIRGINGAIEQKIADSENRPIRILYAGTGPYAALITPLLNFYKPNTIIVDLLEINSVSLNSAVDILNCLNLQSFLGDVYCADATTFKVTKNYDIVISETMQAALKKEPQVAIMQNLIPQLSPQAIFIPQQITIDAALVSRGRWNSETCMFDNLSKIELGRVMTVDRNQLRNEQFKTMLQMPKSIGERNTLMLFTSIQVFDSHFLGENDSSLNIPYKLGEVEENSNENLIFSYEQGLIPHIKCHFFKENKTIDAVRMPFAEKMIVDINIA